MKMKLLYTATEKINFVGIVVLEVVSEFYKGQTILK